MPTISEDYVPRALAAWYRSSAIGPSRQYPSEALSMQVALPDGKQYVVLANSYGVLGVYRIRPSGLLRLLRRWPRAVEHAAGWPREEVVNESCSR
jgi:hypothetical protein